MSFIGHQLRVEGETLRNYHIFIETPDDKGPYEFLRDTQDEFYPESASGFSRICCQRLDRLTAALATPAVLSQSDAKKEAFIRRGAIILPLDDRLYNHVFRGPVI